MASTAAWAELVDRVAAVVNNDVIAQSEVELRAAPELARIRAEPDGTKRAELRREIMAKTVDLLVGEKLMDAQIRELNIEVTDAEIDAGIDDVKKQNGIDGAQFEQLLLQEGYTLASYRSFMKKHMAKLKLVNLKVRSKVKISDEDLKAEYAKMSRDESLDAEVHARHLLVQLPPKPTPEQVEAARVKAQALAEEARQPSVDFAQLAMKKSDGPSASEGGDLGFFRRGTMVAEFERAAFGLPLGGVSDPVRTKFGWHVIKVEERRAGAPKPFDEVKEVLRDKLLRSQLERYTEQYVQELRVAAAVEVKP
ncbi:MAG: peptidylprolyl isomerase [Archangium sp.]|nr:peptidylprolyl isomerase [Archangium sp.]